MNGSNINSSASSYVISFNNLTRASDLWLFYQVTDFGTKMENLQVILSPGFEGKVWYKKDAVKKTLTIYGDASGEVSYRLTANRHDWKNWTNFLDPGERGTVVGEK